MNIDKLDNKQTTDVIKNNNYKIFLKIPAQNTIKM